MECLGSVVRKGTGMSVGQISLNPALDKKFYLLFPLIKGSAMTAYC